MHSFLTTATLVASTLTSVVSAIPLNPRGGPGSGSNAQRSDAKIAVYYGQGYAQAELSTFCAESSYDIIPIGFVNGFGNGWTWVESKQEFTYNYGWPSANFGNMCGSDNYKLPNGTETNMFKSCGVLATNIDTCKKAGKKILLSLGGANDRSPYQLGSEEEGRAFAEQVWGMFGPKQAGWGDQPRPFGDVVVDGFDLDLEMGDNTGYAAMAQRLRELMGNGYLLTAAPQCHMPDPHLATALSQTRFDHIYVQFYNTDQCSAVAGIKKIKKTPDGSNDINFNDWANFANGLNQFPKPKVFIGLPGSPAAAQPGYYISSSDAKLLLDQYHTNSAFGGVMIWEATAARTNEDGDYTHAIKSALDQCYCGQNGCSATTTTTSTTTTTTTTSNKYSTTSVTTTTSRTTTASTTSSKSSVTPQSTTTSTTKSTATSTTSSATSNTTKSTSTTQSTTPSTTTSTMKSTTSNTTPSTTSSTILSTTTSTTKSTTSSTTSSGTKSASTTSSVTLSTASSPTTSTTSHASTTITKSTTSSFLTTTDSSSLSTSSYTNTLFTFGSAHTSDSSAATSSDASTATSTFSRPPSGSLTTRDSTSMTTTLTYPPLGTSTTSNSGSTTPNYSRTTQSTSTSSSKSTKPTSSGHDQIWDSWNSATSSRSVDATSKPSQSWSAWSSTTSKAVDPVSSWTAWDPTISKSVDPTSTWVSWSVPSTVYVTTTTTVYTDVCPTGYVTKTATITATITVTAVPTGPATGWLDWSSSHGPPSPSKPTNVQGGAWPTGAGGVPTGFYTTQTVCSTGCAATPVTVTVTIPVPTGAITKTVTPTPASPDAVGTGKPAAGIVSASSSGVWTTWAAGTAAASPSGVQGVKAYTGGAAADQAPATAFSVAVCLVLAIAGLVL